MGRVQMQRQNRVLLLLTALIGLVGCAPIPSFMMQNSVTFDVDDYFNYDRAIVFRNNWTWCNYPKYDKKVKYVLNNSQCKLAEGHVPSEIVIEYAPWLTYGQQQLIPELKAREPLILADEMVDGRLLKKNKFKGYDEEAIKYNTTILRHNTELAIDQLPASSWKRIVLHPADLVFKYRFKKPSGRGNRLRGKELHYIITLNPDGSYKVEDKLYWVSPYSKYGQ